MGADPQRGSGSGNADLGTGPAAKHFPLIHTHCPHELLTGVHTTQQKADQPLDAVKKIVVTQQGLNIKKKTPSYLHTDTAKKNLGILPSTNYAFV